MDTYVERVEKPSQLQEDSQDLQPVATGSSIAAYGGYLHFTDECLIIKPKGEKGAHIVYFGDKIVRSSEDKSLIYEDNQYEEGDYITVAGGGVGDNSGFRKKHGINECYGLDIFLVQ